MGVPVKHILAPNVVPSVFSFTTAPAKRLASEARLEQKCSKEHVEEALCDFKLKAYKAQAIVDWPLNLLESRQVIFVSVMESLV